MQTKERFTFAGLEISQGPVFFHQGRFVHPEGFPIPYGWKINSFGKAFGKTDGSTYFNWNEVQNIDLDGWRLPTKDEWNQIIRTSRPGAVYNGQSGSCFALIQVDIPFAGVETSNGVLLFPDDAFIDGIKIRNINQHFLDDGYAQTENVSEDELNALLKQGCVFLPASGCCDDENDWKVGGDRGFYWSSTECDDDDGPYNAWFLDLEFDEIRTTYCYKSGNYNSIRLVKKH